MLLMLHINLCQCQKFMFHRVHHDEMLAKALRFEVKDFEPFDATKMATCSCSSCFTHVNMMIMVMMSQLRSIVTPHNFALPNNSKT